MKISFVWYWSEASKFKPHWRDGLRAALEIIERDHRVDWFLDEQIPPDGYDAYIIWGDSNCPAIKAIASYKGKKALCLSTTAYRTDNLTGLDAIYCESDPVMEGVRRQGLRAIKAFGTDDVFFSPTEVVKDIEYFYPATFSPWKRQHAIANLGPKLLCVGTVQPDGLDELSACKKNNVRIIEGYLPVEEIRDYYNRTKKIIIPAVHGSERTVLEAMSMNILPNVTAENKKAHSYIEEYKASPFKTPREFIQHYYSAKAYAKNILKGIL